MTSTEFAQWYKNESTEALLNIVANPQGRKAEAILAAQAELDDRGLGRAEIEQAQSRVSADTLSEAEQWTRWTAAKTEQIRRRSREALAIPQTADRRAVKRLRIIAVCILSIFVLTLWNEGRIYWTILFHAGSDWDILAVFIIGLTLSLAPTAVFLWMQKPAAWISGVILMCHKLAATLSMLIVDLFQRPSSLPVTNAIFPESQAISFFYVFVIFGGMLYTLFLPGVRSLCSITQHMVWKSIACGVGLWVMSTIFMY